MILQMNYKSLQKTKSMESLIIKRQKFSTYHEINIVCTESGKEITRESNIDKRIRYGNKTYLYNGKKYNVLKWERII